MIKKKIVYVGLFADILHEGHINILKTSSKFGMVVVGLLTDKAIASYKIKFVKKVIPQKTLDYRKNLKKIKPAYVVHGDDWKTGIQKKTRSQVIRTLKKWGGKLIEPEYTKNISSSLIKNKIQKKITLEIIRNNKSLLK